MLAPCVDPCPYCNHEHIFDPENEEFVDAETETPCNVTTAFAQGKKKPVEVLLSLCCNCSAIVGVIVVDEFGEQLYIPPTNEWNESHGY